MYKEATQFTRWLQCKHPHTSTHIHYASDLRLFFAWANKPPDEITVKDVDTYITHAQAEGHAIATINRRLTALSAFYQFLCIHANNPPTNPVIPRRYCIKQGRRLPCKIYSSSGSIPAIFIKCFCNPIFNGVLS